jgi:hypothetical protein
MSKIHIPEFVPAAESTTEVARVETGVIQGGSTFTARMSPEVKALYAGVNWDSLAAQYAAVSEIRKARAAHRVLRALFGEGGLTGAALHVEAFTAFVQSVSGRNLLRPDAVRLAIATAGSADILADKAAFAKFTEDMQSALLSAIKEDRQTFPVTIERFVQVVGTLAEGEGGQLIVALARACFGARVGQQVVYGEKGPRCLGYRQRRFSER